MERRTLISSALAGGIASLLPRAARAAIAPAIPQRAGARVIVDNDFAGDPDGLVALAHQLLAPRSRVVLVTSSALSQHPPAGEPVRGSAALGKTIALELIRQGGFAPVPVEAGSETPGVGAEQVSAAARAIVAEAMRDDPLPLYITCGGPLTNIAAALRLEPRIARRATLVWIGGGNYPAGGWEYNCLMDLASAQQVVERSDIPLWQVPQGAYRQMQYPISAMRTRLRAVSPFGKWLYDHFTTPPSFIDVGGTWPLGDSPLVLLTAISAESSTARDLPARRILPDGRYGAPVPGRKVRVYETLDARLVFDDFDALMAIHAAGG